MRNRAIIAVAFVALSGLAHAQPLTKGYRAEQKFSIAPGGSIVLENPVGNVEITGGEGTEIEAIALTTITALTPSALEEGRRGTSTIVGGDPKMRSLRATIAPSPAGDWRASVDWILKIPRLTHVNVLSRTSQRILIVNIAGNVRVKNFAGTVTVANATANTIVDSVNGSIAFSTPQLGPSVTLTTVNGTITASVPADGELNWVAETAKGDIRTNLPARGTRDGDTYRGTINGEGKSTITTASLMGNVFLVANGSGIAGTHSVKHSVKQAPKPGQPNIVQADFTQTAPYEGFLRFYTSMGDISVPEVRGSADISTGAGLVQLPKVTGDCRVFSKGGPLSFGEIGGVLDANTLAGDITVDRARRGGTATTRGGTIRIFYMNGPMGLFTLGGDIMVRRTTAPVTAQTGSGDIAVVIDRGSATETVDAKTEKGNIIVHVPMNFSADVDATIVTSDPDNDTFLSDIPGLSISREQIGSGKTRLRATGKLNRGGERLLLDATNGDIRITTAPPAPAIAKRKN